MLDAFVQIKFGFIGFIGFIGFSGEFSRQFRYLNLRFLISVFPEYHAF